MLTKEQQENLKVGDYLKIRTTFSRRAPEEEYEVVRVADTAFRDANGERVIVFQYSVGFSGSRYISSDALFPATAADILKFKLTQ